jgi:hypothetical protein
MQADGNLVVYKAGQGPQWASGTNGSGNWAVMQGDGNLVVYSASNTARWSTNTSGLANARLVLQDDGNLVIYEGSRAIWSRFTGKISVGGGTPGALASQVVTHARSYAIGSYGGQCKVFAAKVINEVFAANGRSTRIRGYGSPGGAYYGAYQNAGGVLVPLSDVRQGDLIQTINPAQKNSDFPTTRGLHTAIVVGVNGPNNVVVRDSNSHLDEKVAEHQWSPGTYAAARGAAAYVWRFN